MKRQKCLPQMSVVSNSAPEICDFPHRRFALESLFSSLMCTYWGWGWFDLPLLWLKAWEKEKGGKHQECDHASGMYPLGLLVCVKLCMVDMMFMHLYMGCADANVIEFNEHGNSVGKYMQMGGQMIFTRVF